MLATLCRGITQKADPMEYDPILSHSSANSTADGSDRHAAADAAGTLRHEASEVADQVGQSTARVADRAREAGAKAAGATRAYARDAVDAAGKTVRVAQGQLRNAKESANDYIHHDPVRAVTVAAIGGALLSAVLIGLTRRGR